jgi:endonuclease G
MRVVFAILLGASVLFLSPFQADAIIDATLQMQLGNPSGATTNIPANTNHFLIQRTVEAMDYSDALGLPNWVSWDLTSADVGSATRSTVYFTDTTLPFGFYEVTDTDYNGVGGINFNRGHMCPSEDRTDTEADNDLVFYMSNIIPQAANNNQHAWADFETYCRGLANSGNELLIMCGPSGFGTNKIPSGKVFIPDYTWKIAVVVPLGAGTATNRITANTRVISIKIPNSNSVSNTPWQDYITSASVIEADTGFTFFTALSAPIASALRSKVDGQTNSAPVLLGFSPASGLANSSVIITGTNFGSASAVTFNGVNASFTVDTTNQITATVPPSATTGPISITTPSGSATSSSNFTVIVPMATDLVIKKTHSGNFTQGDSADTYTITVTNNGGVASSGTITVTDTLPAGLTATFIGGSGWSSDLGTLTCTRSDVLAAGAGYPPITVTVSVSSNAPTFVTNNASVSGGGDTNLANNSASDITIVNAAGSATNIVVLAGWDVSGNPGGLNNFGPSPMAPTTNAPSVAVVGLTRGSGVGTINSGAQRAWGGTTFTSTSSAAAISANQFVTFGITANTGYRVSFTSIARFDYRHSATGPTNGLLQYSIGSGAFIDIAPISYPTNNTSSIGSVGSIDLSTIPALQNVDAGTNVTFRIVNWGATSSAGTWYVFDVMNNSDPDFVIQGILAPVSTLTPIESWRLAWYGTTNNSGNAADSYVNTSDGMPNLIKYALGLNPLVPTANPVVVDTSTGFLRLTSPKNPNATDVTFIVEAADDVLGPWTTSGTTMDQNTSTLLQVNRNMPVSSANKGFIRLRVSRP